MLAQENIWQFTLSELVWLKYKMWRFGKSFPWCFPIFDIWRLYLLGQNYSKPVNYFYYFIIHVTLYLHQIMKREISLIDYITGHHILRLTLSVWVTIWEVSGQIWKIYAIYLCKIHTMDIRKVTTPRSLTIADSSVQILWPSSIVDSSFIHPGTNPFLIYSNTLRFPWFSPSITKKIANWIFRKLIL